MALRPSGERIKPLSLMIWSTKFVLKSHFKKTTTTKKKQTWEQWCLCLAFVSHQVLKVKYRAGKGPSRVPPALSFRCTSFVPRACRCHRWVGGYWQRKVIIIEIVQREWDNWEDWINRNEIQRPKKSYEQWTKVLL